MSAEFEPWRCTHAVDDEGAWPQAPLVLGHPLRSEERWHIARMKRESKKRANRRIVRLARLELALQQIAGIEHSFKAARIAREALHG